MQTLRNFHQLHELVAQAKGIIATAAPRQCRGSRPVEAADVTAAAQLLSERSDGSGEAQILAGSADWRDGGRRLDGGLQQTTAVLLGRLVTDAQPGQFAVARRRLRRLPIAQRCLLYTSPSPRDS